jgi:hypothetical protein
LILALCGLLSLIVGPLAQISADNPTATLLVDNNASLLLSNQFRPPNGIGLTGAGDVLFSPQSALFRWESSSGTRSRILQSGEPHPGFPGSVTDLVANPFHVNSLGHAATVNFFAKAGSRIPRGVFLYDGSTFQIVAMRGDVAPGTGGQLFNNFGAVRINDTDQIVLLASFEPSFNNAGVFLGSTSGPPAKIAAIGDVAPGTGGGTYNSFQLIGFNNAGQVAFFSNILGGSASRAVFIGSTSGVSKVVAQGDPATGTAGTFNLVTLNPFNYALNSNGDVAFAAQVIGGAAANQGVWIGNSTSAPAKLMVNSDPTATTLGGTFGGAVFLHGFDSSGQALFRSNPVGATATHALFLKDLNNPASVVFARGEAVPGGTTELFANTLQATVNSTGDVAFLALLQGPVQFGWFLKESAAPIVKIALQGDSTPAGGTFGLAGANQPAEINGSGQVAFFADVLGPNATGVFLYTSGSGIASVVNSNDTLPPGANPVIRTFMPAASDDLLVFHGSKAGGRISTFTKTLDPCNDQITRIVGEGDTAPVIGGAMWGMPGNFGLINDSEELAFATSEVVGATVYPASIVFTHKPGLGLQKVAATGDAAPGAAGGTISTFDIGSFFRPPARINSSGQVAFFAGIAGSMSNSSPNGIFIGSASGGIQRVARAGDASPVGGIFANFQTSDISLNDAGQVAFRGVTQVSPGVQTPALFVGTGTAAPVKAVAQGDAGPGGSSVNVIPVRFQINNAGQIAYVAGLTGGSSPEGVFLGTAGGTQVPVALAGDPAPGTSGGTFSGFREPEIELNNPGDVAFSAEITGALATSGYFLGSATTAPAARLIEGEALPGGGAAGFLSPGINNFIGEQFSLTDSGEMSIFLNNITGAPSLGRYVIASASGVLREFAATDDDAQGTGSSFGALFQSVGTNSTGRFFFMAILVGGPEKSGVFWDGPGTQLTALGPANVWIGLKNSDDVGTRFDLLAEGFKNGSLIGSGQLNGVPGGSSGFNNAVLRTINMSLTSPVNVSAGDTLSVRLSVRIAVGVAGHRSGTARLWYNDAAANSRVDATNGCAAGSYFLLNGFALGTVPGPGPKKTIDVFVDRLAGGNPFKPFGTWSKTF